MKVQEDNVMHEKVGGLVLAGWKEHWRGHQESPIPVLPLTCSLVLEFNYICLFCFSCWEWLQFVLKSNLSVL